MLISHYLTDYGKLIFYSSRISICVCVSVCDDYGIQRFKDLNALLHFTSCFKSICLAHVLCLMFPNVIQNFSRVRFFRYLISHT